MADLTVDFREIHPLTAQGVTLTVMHDGQPTELLIQGVTLDTLADFAAAEHFL